MNFLIPKFQANTATDTTPVIEVPTIPSYNDYGAMWDAIQGGSWAVILVIAAIWLRYGQGLVKYLNNQEKILDELVKIANYNKEEFQDIKNQIKDIKEDVHLMMSVPLPPHERTNRDDGYKHNRND